MSICPLCKYERDSFVGEYCENCHQEDVCQRCNTPGDTYIGLFRCEICEKNISINCDDNCLALCWCQAVECICRDCISNYDTPILCKECDKDMRKELSKSTRSVAEDGDCLCDKCNKNTQ
jgi:hypothetical protein